MFSISNDPPEFAPPISFVLRRVLETATGFEEAIAILRHVKVASDSLLLVSGIRPGEMAVVERSPARSAVRGPDKGFLAVANDYRALPVSAGAAAEDEIAATSCTHRERAEHLLRSAAPVDADGCLQVLKDPGIRMRITVQHMALSAATGMVRLEIPYW